MTPTPESPVTTTPAFWQFAGAYLHQDWPEEYGDPWRALEAFMTDEPSLARALVDEIGQVLQDHPSEDELASYVNGEGACYVPGPDEGGYRGWLTEVARRVRAATA